MGGEIPDIDECLYYEFSDSAGTHDSSMWRPPSDYGGSWDPTDQKGRRAKDEDDEEFGKFFDIDTAPGLLAAIETGRPPRPSSNAIEAMSALALAHYLGQLEAEHPKDRDMIDKIRIELSARG